MDNNELKDQIDGLKQQLKRMQWIVEVLAVLVILLMTQSILGYKDDGQQKAPDFLTESVKTSMAEIVKNAYNTGDAKIIYDILGPYAQTVHTPEQIQMMLEGLKVVGYLEKSTFTHYEYLGYDQGAEWYTIYYAAKFQNGIGGLRITLRVVEDEWEIAGFFMNVDRLITY